MRNLGERIGGCKNKEQEKKSKNEQCPPGKQTTCSPKKTRKIEKQKKESAQLWRADWGLCHTCILNNELYQ